MFAVPWFVLAIFLFVHALAGAALGLAAGWITAWSLRSKCRFLRDSSLGALGAPLGIIITALTPFPKNTVIEYANGQITEMSTMNRYQHPERIAVLFAILLPILHELFRAKKQMSREPR